MNNKKGLLVVVLALIMIIGTASILYDHLGEEADVEQIVLQPTQPEITETEDASKENEAPDFTVYDVDGNAMKLSDYFGKPIVLNFWASWCGPCQMEMPAFEEKYKEIGNDVQFLIVNVTDGHRETVETASKFITNKGYTFPVLYDTSWEAVVSYNVNAMPTTYFIDENGCVATYAIGAIDEEILTQYIELIY